MKEKQLFILKGKLRIMQDNCLQGTLLSVREFALWFLAFAGLAVAVKFQRFSHIYINDNAIFRLAKLPLMTTKHNIST